METLGDLLFELSHDERRKILLLLREKASRLTHISKELGLTVQEVSRHLSRLDDSNLTLKGADGLFRLTPYGELVLGQLQEWRFLNRYRDYFTAHSTRNLLPEAIKRIGDLEKSQHLNNVMDFIRCVETLIIEAERHVWLLVDQMPMNNISAIIASIERGVKYRVMEPRERVFNSDLGVMASEEDHALSRTRHTPLIEQRMLDEVRIFLYISDSRCVVAFPTPAGENDYKGFTSTDALSIRWCRDIYEAYWDDAEERPLDISTVRIDRKRTADIKEPHGSIVVVGRENSDIDAQAVQDAVDNYDVVNLRGIFNFGTSKIQISRSVAIRGEGRENDVPSTIIYKKGWRFPSAEFDSIFMVDGEGAEVTIENIQFTDFNHICIWGVQCDSLNIKNNRITLTTGYGRGLMYGAFGDTVIGIWIRGSEPRVFKGKVRIEGNYIDFARGGAFGGFITRGGLEENSEYRPDLFNHEYYMSVGVGVNHASGAVNIEDNIVRNANARGIATTSCLPSADVRIRRNTIVSDVYGSYPFSSPEAGAGILAQSAFGFPSSGYNVEIEENTIKLDKLNFCGVIVLGPSMDREGVDKLKGGTIRNNHIHLKKGYEGIHIRKCDDFEVADNEVSGEAYYGIRVSGSRRHGKLDLKALNNMVEDNKMSDLRIREPDKYSNNHVDGRMFTGSEGRSATAHVWLNTYTKGNVIKVNVDEKVIDESEGNTILYVAEEA